MGYASKTEMKMKLQTKCTLPRNLFWKEEAGTTIPRDSIKLIDVVQHDILSQMIAPFEYFLRSGLNCKISSVIKISPSQICDYEIIALTNLPC